MSPARFALFVVAIAVTIVALALACSSVPEVRFDDDAATPTPGTDARAMMMMMMPPPDGGQPSPNDASTGMSMDASALPGPPPMTCSKSSGPDTLTFQNNEPFAVEVWWIGFDCKEVYYYDVTAGMSKQQSTYQDHTWRIRAQGSHMLIKEVGPRPNGKPTTVPIP